MHAYIHTYMHIYIYICIIYAKTNALVHTYIRTHLICLHTYGNIFLYMPVATCTNIQTCVTEPDHIQSQTSYCAWQTGTCADSFGRNGPVLSSMQYSSTTQLTSTERLYHLVSSRVVEQLRQELVASFVSSGAFHPRPNRRFCPKQLFFEFLSCLV